MVNPNLSTLVSVATICSAAVLIVSVIIGAFLRQQSRAINTAITTAITQLQVSLESKLESKEKVAELATQVTALGFQIELIKGKVGA